MKSPEKVEQPLNDDIRFCDQCRFMASRGRDRYKCMLYNVSLHWYDRACVNGFEPTPVSEVEEDEDE